MIHGYVDAHVHLSPLVSPRAIAAAAELDRQLAESGIERAVVLHLVSQPWSLEEFAEAIARFPRLVGFANVDPTRTDAATELRRAAEQLGYIGLKLHPRLQRFSLEDPAVGKLIGAAGELGLPVLIDAFPDGDWLMMGFDPLAFARIAKACPQTNIIVAHFGGHRCIDFMMLAKRIPNLWFDLSFSLLYYAGSDVVTNLIYCCRSMKFERIFFGTDYPDRPVKVSLKMSLETLSRFGIGEEHMTKLMSRNAVEFFDWAEPSSAG